MVDQDDNPDGGRQAQQQRSLHQQQFSAGHHSLPDHHSHQHHQIGGCLCSSPMAISIGFVVCSLVLAYYKSHTARYFIRMSAYYLSILVTSVLVCPVTMVTYFFCMVRKYLCILPRILRTSRDGWLGMALFPFHFAFQSSLQFV